MKISEYCKNLYSTVENEQTNKLEKIAFFCFCFFVILVSFFHEPWFDEFQAWGISKDSLYNILFVIPHYEGHTPLWHLIIKCFSIFNINPELCIKIPNTIFIALGTWFLIFKSPFPRTVRILLPFTYFIFYQYGVICRPYSMFYLAIVLCAVFFNTRNTNPFRYVSVLGFLAYTSSHGLAVATGITIAWGLEQLDFKNFKHSFISFIKSKQFLAMVLMFVFCLLITLEIYPSGHNTALSLIRFLPVWQKILFCLFGTLSDSLVYNVISEHAIFNNFFEDIYGCYIFAALCFGLSVLVFLILIFRKTKTLFYFLVPYTILFLLFIGYYNPHHTGLIFFLIVFSLWISYEKIPLVLTKKENFVLKMLVILVLAVQFFWGMVSAAGDIFLNYECSRDVANYIKKHELYKYKIFAGGWSTHYYIDKDGAPFFAKCMIKAIDENNKGQYIRVSTDLLIHNIHVAVILLPFFQKNIFYNFNADLPEKLYALHKMRTVQEHVNILNKWRELGYPDLVLDESELDYVWKDSNLLSDYILVKRFNYSSMWKGYLHVDCYGVPLYMRKDLYEKLNYKKYVQDDFKKMGN